MDWLGALLAGIGLTLVRQGLLFSVNISVRKGRDVEKSVSVGWLVSIPVVAAGLTALVVGIKAMWGA